MFSDAAGPARRPAPTVLVADGCEHGRRRVRETLDGAGLRRIYEAADGAEAVGLLGALSPDLMVLDWDLPVIGAAEIIALARGVDGAQPLPLVLTMARPLREAVDEAVALGVTSIVAKPFSARLLRSRIDAIRPGGRAATAVATPS